MNNIPTAEEYFIYHNQGNYKDFDNSTFTGKELKVAMIEFAKFHTKAALEAATKKSRVVVSYPLDYDDRERAERHIDYFEVSEKSILNAYPLTNIK